MLNGSEIKKKKGDKGPVVEVVLRQGRKKIRKVSRGR